MLNVESVAYFLNKKIYKYKTMANKKYKHVFMVNKNNNLYLKYTYINIIQILLLVH